MTMSRLSTLEILPNEVLFAIIECLSIPALLKLTLVSRRVHSVATDALKHRLLATARLGRQEVLLECYHPTAKLTTPSISCPPRAILPLGSQSLDPEDWDLRDLGRLYSRFRPEAVDAQGAASVNADGTVPKPVQDVFLDDGELFSQLCASTSIVRKGPRPGLFLGHHGIGEGVVRVWRRWLAEAAVATRTSPFNPTSEDGILWADPYQNIGVRFTVDKAETQPTQTQMLGGHLLVSSEEPPVEYTLHYEELLVRTNRVLLAVDRSGAHQVANTDKDFYVSLGGEVNAPVTAVFWSTQNHPAYTRPPMGMGPAMQVM